MKTRILITGVDGFVGGHLYEYLKTKKNINVYGTALNYKGKDKNIFKLDLTDNYCAFRVLPEKIDIVIHLAARLSNSNEESFSPGFAAQECLKINSEGTFMILDFLRLERKIKQFIYMSTGAVYGQELSNPKETDVPHPDTWYAVSKHIAELYARKSCEQDNIKYTILRFCSLYGANQGKFLINYLLNQIQKGEDIEITGNGTKKLDMLYIKDVVSIIPRFFNKQGIFNIGTGTGISIIRIATEMCARFGLLPLTSIQLSSRSQKQERSVIMDNTKARKFYKIKYPLEKALQDMQKEMM
jgi:UDP-glucose 4-epimerase